MFLMALGIRGTFGFADCESGEKRGSDTDSNFGCMYIIFFERFSPFT